VKFDIFLTNVLIVTANFVSSHFKVKHNFCVINYTYISFPSFQTQLTI